MVTADIRDGYRGLANFVGSQLDSGLGVFKRFSQLNTLNLLYMQAELVVLEQELRVIAQIDDTCGDLNRYNFARSVRSMKGDPSSQQWSKVLECRRMLEKYNEALIQQSQLSRMDKGRDYDRNVVLHWIKHDQGGKKFLNGAEARPWMPSEQYDLVAVFSRATNDFFTRCLEEKVMPWLYWIFLYPWKKPIKGQENTGMVNFENSRFIRLARALNIMLSTLIPSIAILGLFFIERPVARLGAILGFSAVFSLILAMFTNARPVEIFTATAAFASVQVVFVGGTNTSGQIVQCECKSMSGSNSVQLPSSSLL